MTAVTSGEQLMAPVQSPAGTLLGGGTEADRPDRPTGGGCLAGGR